MHSTICVSYDSKERQSQAESFGSQHDLSCLPYSETDTELILNFTADFLELKDTSNKSSVHVDFISGALNHRRKYGGGRGQAIAKAIGLKQGTTPPIILDATAGLGKDAFVLACLGCPVTMIERSPIIAELVKDALIRAQDNEEMTAVINKGFKIINDNAIHYMNNLSKDDKPDVIYLDPMYPERKKSAQVKKNMQILQKLLGHDLNSSDLIEAALSCAKSRVVVKRPKGAELISDRKPTMQIESKKTRYDVYVIKAI